MDPHAQLTLSPADSRRLEGLAWPLFAGSLVVGIAGLTLAFLIALFLDRGLSRFGHAYLAAYAFVLSLSVGGLFFTLGLHLFRAGWSALIRRVPEVLAAAMPAMAVLALPLLIYVIAWNGMLYPWARELHGGHGEQHEAVEHAEEHAAVEPADPGLHQASAQASEQLVFAAPEPAAEEGGHDTHEVAGLNSLLDATLAHGVHSKGPWYSGWFWTLRVALCFVIWSAMGLWLWKTSTRQDLTGDAMLTRKMEIHAPWMMIVFGITLTFGAFDLLMSLDPTWFSTMYGIYYFGATFQAVLAAIILILLAAQSRGFFPSVSREHYHDLGKLMFAFVVFWAYVTFAQYLLIWYAAIPAEQPWMIMRGMSTHEGHETPWQMVALLILFGRFVIPFLGLMSRHVKRRNATLAFWSVWLLVMHAIEMWWNVLPSFDAEAIHLPIVEILCLLGVLGLFSAAAVRIAARHSLVPIGDPRVPEALSFRNI